MPFGPFGLELRAGFAEGKLRELVYVAHELLLRRVQGTNHYVSQYSK